MKKHLAISIRQFEGDKRRVFVRIDKQSHRGGLFGNLECGTAFMFSGFVLYSDPMDGPGMKEWGMLHVRPGRINPSYERTFFCS